MSDAGSERGGPGGSRRPGFFENDGKVRDFSNWERKGPLSPVPQPGPPVRDGGRVREAGGPREDRQGAAWGEGRSDAGSRPPRKEYEKPQERPQVERAPTAAEQDNQWRARMKPDAPTVATPDVATPTSPVQEAPKERPRLNLAKRTVSATAPEDSASTPASDAKASPFGAARPIDTAAREREVEEKRQLAIRQKKEADDKAREEKAAREAAAKAARADKGETEGEAVTSPTAESGRVNRRPSRQQNGTKAPVKEDSEATQQSRPKFSILQRETDGAAAEGPDGDEDAVGDDIDTPANGTITADKETKPQEITVSPDASAESTADALEEDGWSTVPASGKVKNSRRGGARALAS